MSPVVASAHQPLTAGGGVTAAREMARQTACRRPLDLAAVYLSARAVRHSLIDEDDPFVK